MKVASRLAIAVFVLLPTLAGGGAPDAVKIVVFVTTAKQEGPLQITGFILPDKVGAGPTLVVRNTADKPVSDFSLAVALGNPAPDSRGEMGPAYYTGGPTRDFRPSERQIPPNSERQVHQNGLHTHYLAHWGGELHSTCLHVAAIVSRVTFADGTNWELEQNAQQTWKDSLQSDSTKGCDHSPAAEIALRDWDGASGNAETGSSSHLDSRTVQSYSVACPLRNLSGKLVAICPW